MSDDKLEAPADTEKVKTRKRTPTQELFHDLLARMTAMDERSKRIEANLVLLQHAVHKVGTEVAGINDRCLRRMEDLCPLNGTGTDGG